MLEMIVGAAILLVGIFCGVIFAIAVYGATRNGE